MNRPNLNRKRVRLSKTPAELNKGKLYRVERIHAVWGQWISAVHITSVTGHITQDRSASTFAKRHNAMRLVDHQCELFGMERDAFRLRRVEHEEDE